MGISFRLRQVAEQVTEGYTIADIGTDHGYVPVSLLRSSRVPRAIAVDISPGSLQKAIDLAARAGVTEQMDCRLGDGLHVVAPGEADCVIICGMGGILMRRILEEGKETVLSAKELILSPHRNPELIREFLEENGYSIVLDTLIEDKKKQYPLFKGIR